MNHQDKNGHAVDEKGQLVFDPLCHGCDAPHPISEWEKDFLELHYEPEHESGGACWCGVSYFKIPQGMEIKHKEQRVLLVDFIRFLLQSEKDKSYQEGLYANTNENRPMTDGEREIAISLDNALREELYGEVKKMQGKTFIHLGSLYTEGYENAIADVLKIIKP